MEKTKEETKSSLENYRERIEKIKSRLKKREEIASAVRLLESNGYTVEKTDEFEPTPKIRESNDFSVEKDQEDEEDFEE